MKLSIDTHSEAWPLAQEFRIARGAKRIADVVVVRFGDKYRQWNAAFDAGYAAALGKPVITLHGPEHTHALKEVDGAALAVAESPEQVVQILAYVTKKV